MPSSSNLRLHANCLAELQACRRDKQIEQQGFCVVAMIPIDEAGAEDEHQVDFYGDPCVANRKDKEMWILPNYDEYYSLINIMGEDSENPLPLVCSIKSTDHWPRETIFGLPVVHANGEVITKWWKVMNEEGKHLEIYYDKRIQVVPARDHELEGIV